VRRDRDKAAINEKVTALIARRRPGFALERAFYTDPDVYALELERIILANWFLAGHVSELRGAGSFKRFDVADESALIVRGDDGCLRAYANVCRHRGSRICLEERGCAARFVCPYHGWTYDTRGRLVAARSMGDGFDPARYRLARVACGEIHGLVFVCFSDDPPSLDGAIRELEAPMKLFDLPGLKVAAHRSYAIAANWKFVVENYQECYHCAPAHPDYARMHTLMVEPGKRERLQSAMRARMADCGLEDVFVDRIDTRARNGEMGYGYSRTALFDGYVTGSEDGRPVAPLLGGLEDYDGGASDFSFGAFSFLLAYSDHVVAYVFKPVDQDNSIAQLYWLVRGDAVEGRDYDTTRLAWLWHTTMQADEAIILDTARGVRSRYYEPGPFSEMERAECTWVDWVLGELGRDRGQGSNG